MWQTCQTAFLILESHMTQLFRIQYCCNLEHDIKLSFAHSFSQTLFKLSINTQATTYDISGAVEINRKLSTAFSINEYTPRKIFWLNQEVQTKMHSALISIELSWLNFWLSQLECLIDLIIRIWFVLFWLNLSHFQCM